MFDWVKKLSRVEAPAFASHTHMSHTRMHHNLETYLLYGGFKGELLKKLQCHWVPRSCWSERYRGGDTLLHIACYGNNVDAAVVLLELFHPNVTNWSSCTPAHIAAFHGQPRVLEVLCAAGADVCATTSVNGSPLDLALKSSDPGAADCVRVLLANGVRLAMVSKKDKHSLKPWMLALEKGRILCRSVVVALLGLKRRRLVLPELDRWVVRQIAVAVFATRADPSWQQVESRPRGCTMC